MLKNHDQANFKLKLGPAKLSSACINPTIDQLDDNACRNCRMYIPIIVF